MGLDMFLKGKRYLWSDDEDTVISQEIAKLFPELASHQSRMGRVVNEIAIDAGYWRKANHIHQWFVENVQKNVDDCGNYHVSRGQLERLREICQRVLDFKHLANDLLPRQAGFFFGNTDYDEGYYQDIEQTIEIIDRALSMPNNWEFEYHSSW